jgi:hypothetical protein
MAVASRGVEKTSVGRTESGGAPDLDRRASERGDRGVRGEPGPRVCGLSSARDRARLRERYAAERARVEQALARGPLGLEAESEVEVEAAPRPRRRAQAAPIGMPPSAACVCRVCGGDDVAVDFVRDRGTLRLARCGRCDFIWTEIWTEIRNEIRTERAAESRAEPRVIRCLDASAA